jgi:hypothetical protein
VNAVVRVGVLQGEYHWHKRLRGRVLFVVDGRFLVDLEDRSIDLLPRQDSPSRGASCIGRGRPNSIVLMVEAAGIIPPATEQPAGGSFSGAACCANAK